MLSSLSKILETGINVYKRSLKIKNIMKYQLNKLKKIKYYKIKILSACHCELKIGDININLSDNG